MVYQRVSKPSSGNSQIHKKDSPSTVPAMPVQAKSDSASPQEQEMPNYTPLAANWATNNNLMRSMSGTQVAQRQEELDKEEMEPIQAKLTIGQVGDKYEQEADQTAQRVVNQINAPAPQQSTQGQSLQREEMPEDEELHMKAESGVIQREEMPEDEELQMKPASGIIQREEMPEDEELQMKPEVQRKSDGGGMDATPDLEASIQQAKGSGQPLAENIRKPMEQAFGADFRGVNIHTDAQSDQLNQSIQAKAFTTGQDIFFRQGTYDPGSRGGQELIAHELTHVVQQSGGAVQRSVIQRLHGAHPQNFRVTNTSSDDTDCSVTTDLDWDSSVGGKANLADFQSREIVTFNTDPRADMPAYNGLLPAGMRLAGNILTKSVGRMSQPGGSDKHTGVGHAPKFTAGGIPNLRRAAWQLIGTQYYQVKQDGSPIWTNAAGPFMIIRTMQQIGDQFSLSISKVGPNCMVTAGPTLITMETSTVMDTIGGARGDQTADWNTAQNTLVNANGNKPALNFNPIATDVRNNAQGVAVSVDYEYTSCANPAHPFAQAYDIPQAWRNTIYQQARSAARGIVDNVLTGPNPPTQFIITIFRCAGVQQQALQTNENGGTYRVLLRADKLMDMGQWGGDVDTSMAGRESKHGWTNQGKKERFSKAVATHELGHMLHAFSAPNKFLTSTLMPANIGQIQAAVPPDPLADEKIHICRINGQVIQALNGKGYKQKWGYAMNNPGEVVPEVFTAIQQGRNVPKGLAAVYVAYGGVRGGNIDAALQRSFGGLIPAINEPESCIPIINT